MATDANNNLNELKELVEFLKSNGVAEFEMEREDLKVGLKFQSATGLDASHLAALLQANAAAQAAVAPVTLPTVAAQAAAPAAQAAAAAPVAAAAPDPLAGAHIVKSPIVGTFYAAPSPDAEPYVKVGDKVANGKVLCIVEAMKLMNEIESDAAGEIVKVFVETGQPVEYGQPLFALK